MGSSATAATLIVTSPAAHHGAAAPDAPPAFLKPLHITSFSYTASRQLLLDSDHSLQVYSPPRLHSNLAQGFDQFSNDTKPDEGIDALLLALEHHINTSDTSAIAAVGDLVDRANLLTWRGMMSKLLMAVYEVESASTRGRADGWEMNAMVIDGTLYLEESTPPAKIEAKAASEASYQLQSYYGYSFESYCTEPSSSAAASASTSPSAASSDPSSSKRGFEVPNTNQQWCSLVKTGLGDIRMIIGGEVDCIAEDKEPTLITTEDFVELKTNIVIASERDEMMFERHKLLKHYIQSFLLGVPRIIVGFRTREGILTALQSFQTLEIPRLVRGKPYAWSPHTGLTTAHSILTFLLRTIAEFSSMIDCHSRFQSLPSSSTPISSFRSWPVFRITFLPADMQRGRVGEGTVVVRELGEEEIRQDVLGAKRECERVGFVLASWVEGVRLRSEKRKRGTIP